MSPEDSLTDSDAWDHVVSYDAGSERPSEVIVTAVAETTSRDPLVGEPLYSIVDPDALDSLVRDGGDHDVSVSFSYLGCLVHVTRETVRVRLFDGTEHA